MLLKDCPVGSFVRLVSYNRDTNYAGYFPHWVGNFEVLNDGEINYVFDGDGDKRFVSNSSWYQFEIVPRPKSAPENTLNRNGKTYKLTPHVEKKTVTIDGVVYDMEEVE